MAVIKNLLAIDTAGPYLGITLQYQEKVYSYATDERKEQQEFLTLAIDKLMHEANGQIADLDLIVVAEGPGTFTGLRVGMVAAKAITFALHIPMVSIPTLSAYQWALPEVEAYGAVFLDAKKGRYYGQLFYAGKAISDVMDLSALEWQQELLKHHLVWQTTGYGAAPLMQELIESPLQWRLGARAAEEKSQALLASALEYYEIYGADSLEKGPNYLRMSEAEMSLVKAK